MKKLTKIYTLNESASVEELQKRIKPLEPVNELVQRFLTKLNGKNSKNALLLTAIFATNEPMRLITDEFVSILKVGIDTNENQIVASILGELAANDESGAWKKLTDGSKECTWVIYKAYLAKTIAKEANFKPFLDEANTFLRTFKNSCEHSWAEIEKNVKNMNENTLPELKDVETEKVELTNQEQEVAVEKTVKKEFKLLDELIKRAGLNKKQLVDYVTMIVTRSFKEIKDDNTVEWKKKIAKGEPIDDNFILGISAMICGAVITGDKNLTKDIFKYLDTKAQDDLKQAQNKLMK